MDTPCWEWTGGSSGNGYGAFNIEGKSFRAHRVGWLLQTGVEPIYLRHICDNPKCVRASHLLDGEVYRDCHQRNVQDAVARGRFNAARGTKAAKARLKEEDVNPIRKSAAAGATHRQLAAAYGVTHATIGALLRGKTWTHVK
jgi:hypothetical protein